MQSNDKKKKKNKIHLKMTVVVMARQLCDAAPFYFHLALAQN